MSMTAHYFSFPRDLYYKHKKLTGNVTTSDTVILDMNSMNVDMLKVVRISSDSTSESFTSEILTF